MRLYTEGYVEDHFNLYPPLMLSAKVSSADLFARTGDTARRAKLTRARRTSVVEALMRAGDDHGRIRANNPRNRDRGSAN